MDLFEKYYTLSLRYLTRRPRSEKELSDYLKKKFRWSKMNESEQAAFIEKITFLLKKQKFLNDEEFVKWWIEQRTRFRPRGSALIKLELLRKGISKEILESRISSHESSDLEQAKKLVEKKLPKYKHLEKRDIYQKLGSFLARRGFDWDTIKQSIDEAIKEGV